MKEDYFELVKPTYIENWPRELCSMSIAQVNFKLSLEEMLAFVEFVWDGKESSKLVEIEGRIESELIKFPKGAFIRLGSRSPKDVEIKSISTGKEGMELLLNSVRVFDDICLMYGLDYEASVFLREWIQIPEWLEFRCFMKDRKLVGISQYYYMHGYLDIVNQAEIIEWVIRKFFEKFKEKSHLDDIVFDVFLKYNKRFEQGLWEVKLLEVNPFFESTDPCLFDWRKKEDFNGEFRYITDEKMF